MVDVKKITAANLKRIRAAAGMTQEKLAAHLGMKKQYVSAMETGRRGISDAVLPQLCEVFACEPAEFFITNVEKHLEVIDRLLADEIKRMNKRKKALLYASAIAINTANGHTMSRRAEDMAA